MTASRTPAPPSPAIRSPRVKAASDITAGWHRRSLWLSLALQDIRSRYRRSVLGPFWISLQMLAFVLGIGVLYAALFKQDALTFLPYVALGFLMWSFISGMVLDATSTYTSNAHLIRSSSLPLSVYAFRTSAMQVVLFLHNAAVVVVMLLILRVTPSVWALLSVPLAMVVTVVNGFFLVLWLGPLSARFRDVPPLVGTFMQLMLFLTPVFWDPSHLPGRAFVAWNPFAYFLEVFRDPLLDRHIFPGSWLVLVGISVVNVAAGMFVFARNRPHIAYWVG